MLPKKGLGKQQSANNQNTVNGTNSRAVTTASTAQNQFMIVRLSKSNSPQQQSSIPKQVTVI